MLRMLRSLVLNSAGEDAGRTPPPLTAEGDSSPQDGTRRGVTLRAETMSGAPRLVLLFRESVFLGGREEEEGK